MLEDTNSLDAAHFYLVQRESSFVSVFHSRSVKCSCVFPGGSFRHFLWQIARELQGPLLNILVPSSNNSFRGKCILQPGPFTLSEERLIIFLGQVSRRRDKEGI